MSTQPLDRYGMALVLARSGTRTTDAATQRMITRITRRRRTTYVPAGTNLAVPRGTQPHPNQVRLQRVTRHLLARGLDVYDREDGHVSDAQMRGVRA